MILFIIIYVSVSQVTLSWRELQGSQCPFLQHMSEVAPLANVMWGSPTAPALQSRGSTHVHTCTHAPLAYILLSNQPWQPVEYCLSSTTTVMGMILFIIIYVSVSQSYAVVEGVARLTVPVFAAHVSSCTIGQCYVGIANSTNLINNYRVWGLRWNDFLSCSSSSSPTSSSSPSSSSAPSSSSVPSGSSAPSSSSSAPSSSSSAT